MIDFVQGYAYAETSAPIVIPYAFNSWALNRCVVMFIATHHATNGISSDPVLEPVTLDAVQMYGLREGEKQAQAEFPGDPNQPKVPVRNYLYKNDPNVEPPLAGTITFPLRGAATPHNIVVHVIGMTGAIYPGKTDDTAAGSNAALIAASLVIQPEGTEPLVGFSVRGDPPWEEAALLGTQAKLGDLIAGTGIGAVRGTVWRGDLSGNYGVQHVGALGHLYLASGMTGMMFKGGADEGVAPEPPPVLEVGEPKQKAIAENRTQLFFERPDVFFRPQITEATWVDPVTGRLQ